MKTLFLLAAMLALAVPVGAEECVPTTSEAVALEVGDNTYYLVADNELCQPDCLFSLWIVAYTESNGMPGLQRGDFGQDDTCSGQIEADRHEIIV